MKYNTGKAGEEIAEQFLKRKGYTILERNLRIGGSEIDIIAKNRTYLVFVEVKSRWSDNWGDPSEFVNEKKIGKIVDGAKFYSSRRKYRDLFIRFDIISVIWKNSQAKIDHIENAFEVDPK